MRGFKIIYTYQEFIAYRNRIILRMGARRRNFPNDPVNYYEIRLRELNDQYPEFSKFGKIELKEMDK